MSGPERSVLSGNYKGFRLEILDTYSNYALFWLVKKAEHWDKSRLVCIKKTFGQYIEIAKDLVLTEDKVSATRYI